MFYSAHNENGADLFIAVPLAAVNIQYMAHVTSVPGVKPRLFPRRSEHTTKITPVGFVVDKVLKQPISFMYILDSPGSYYTNTASHSSVTSAGKLRLLQAVV